MHQMYLRAINTINYNFSNIGTLKEQISRVFAKIYTFPRFRKKQGAHNPPSLVFKIFGCKHSSLINGIFTSQNFEHQPWGVCAHALFFPNRGMVYSRENYKMCKLA